MGLGVVDEGLRAVAALEQERLAVRDRREPRLQAVDLGGQGDGRDALQHGADVGHVRSLGPLGLLGGRTGQRVVQTRAQFGGERRQLGEHLDRGVVEGGQPFGDGLADLVGEVIGVQA